MIFSSNGVATYKLIGIISDYVHVNTGKYCLQTPVPTSKTHFEKKNIRDMYNLKETVHLRKIRIFYLVLKETVHLRKIRIFLISFK